MRKFNRIISMLLAVFMIIGTLVAAFTIQVFADDSSSGSSSNDSSSSGNTQTPDIEIEAEEEIDYTTQIYATPEEKLATMRLAFENKELGYQLYVDDYSGEVACVNTITGEKLFSNPYDVGASTGNNTTKYEILSQIIVKFTDNQGQEKVFTSFEQAVLRGQIVVENIKNGIRVEYTIGREQTKTLVPRLISKERFDELILAPLFEEFGEELYNLNTKSKDVMDAQRFLTYYVLYSKEPLKMSNEDKNLFGGVTDNLISSDRDLARVLKDYPIVDSMPVYVFNPKASEAEIARSEELILTYCADYTYEELEYDHALTEYESEDENPPVFRMALEYKIEADGLSVRLPANGIRFNESLYTLENIEVLPYMGAGNSGYNGYNFFPDGSGTLFDYAELNTNTTRSIVGKVYGTDFAYHEITGTYQKPIRYPVFGIVEDSYYYTYTKNDIDTGEVTSEIKLAGNIVDTIKNYNEGITSQICKGQEGTLNSKYGKFVYDEDATETKVTDKRGFVASIEEGDALAELSTYHAGSLSDYNTIKMTVTPRPKDSYNLQDSISVGSNSNWTVVCDRKYVGTYKLKYVMLSDTAKEDLNMPAGSTESASSAYKTYDTSWFGMAVAYRDYLYAKEILSEIDSITSDIPLYIETFGAVETTKKILSVPVEVMESLTTFEEVYEMYDYLSGKGIKNINFKLTGYANGGMYYTVPGNLKFERVVGGNDGFQELLDKAAAINGSDDKDAHLGIFPDFDFVYQVDDTIFNKYDKFYHAAKTIDDRYASRREYSATQQKFINYYEIVISPAYYDLLYNDLAGNYVEKYQNVTGISVSTLGQWLHSDFDEDEPYNREDSKEFTIEAFQYLDKTYGEVMTSGGNAYVWKYVDHMLDVSLDSSRYVFSSNAVPFIGVVLHGSVSFAGEPLNMEGDLQYALLKAIENGASPYFILSMDNTQILKEYTDLSQYYSIRYDIWKEDIADIYHTLNDVLSDVQDKYIIGHEFLTGNRIPDADELEADLLNEYLKDLEDERNAAEILATQIALSASQARENGKIAEEEAAKALLAVVGFYASYTRDKNGTVKFDSNYYNRAKDAYKEYYSAVLNGDEAAIEKADTILDAVTDYNKPASDFSAIYDAMIEAIADIEELRADAHEAYMNKVVYDKLSTIYADDAAKSIAATITDKVLNEYTGNSTDDLKAFVAALVEQPENVDPLIDAALDELASSIVKEYELRVEPAEGEEDKFPTSLYNVLKNRFSKIIATAGKPEEFAEYVSEALLASDSIDTTDKAAVKAFLISFMGEVQDADMVAIEETLFTTFVNELANKTVSANVKASGGKDQISELYKVYNNALTTYNNKLATENITDEELATYKATVDAAKAAIDAISTELNAYADTYMMSVAAGNAKNQVIKSGFQLKLEDCIEVYFNYEKNTNYFKNFQKLAKDNNFSDGADEFEAWFAAYATADKAKVALEATASAYVSAKSKGSVDNYIEALAKVGALKDLGFEDNDEVYSVNSNGEETTKAKVYADAKSQALGVRTTAVQATTRLVGSSYKYIVSYYESTLEYLASATAAIEVLAEAEGVTVKYADGSKKGVRDIVNYDEIAKQSSIVKQAIDRATAVADYLEKDRYELITEGRESNLTIEINGKVEKLRTSRDAAGNVYYFCGTEEKGYSYFTLQKDGSFEVYHLGTRTGKFITEEAEIYEYSENGAKVYYTASVTGGYTYYTHNSYYDIFEVVAPITYSGSQVGTLEDGTVIYYDSEYDVYYSENFVIDQETKAEVFDSYNRYNYYQSISAYYESALAESAVALEEVYNMVAECESQDNTYKDDVQRRIDRDNQTSDKEEEEIVEETVSRYHTENIVAVTYGSANGESFKTILLNYNNYTVTIVYDNYEYTVPAYEFVVIEYDK